MIATSSRWVLVGSIALSLALGLILGVTATRHCGAAAPEPAPPPDDAAVRRFAHDLVVRDLGQARTDFAAIPEDSIYKPTAQAAYDDAVRTVTADFEKRAKALAAAKKCDQFNELIGEAVVAGLPDATGMGTCEPAPALATDPASCDADALRDKGQDYLQTGMDAAALTAFEDSMKCRSDAGLLRLAFMAACRSKNAAKAQALYPQLPTATTTGIVQICVRNGITLP
jgi:hypothetical protein